MSSSFCLLLILVTPFAEADQQTITTDETAGAQSPLSVGQEPVITKAIDRLSRLKDVLTDGSQSIAASENSRVESPATLVWVRMSRGFLAHHMERDVDRKKPVRDYILGTTIHGESHTTGKTRLVLHPNDSQAFGEVEFVGEVRALTVGHNGPATLDYTSDSTFWARKRLTIGESGLSASAAVADADTRLRASNIRTGLPWLRDRIVKRIAWRRVANSQSQANAIASDHTADDIRHSLDKRIDESIASIQKKVQVQLAKLQRDGDDRSLVMRSRSTPDYVEVALCRRSRNGDKVKMPSFPIQGNPEIAVRVHQTMLVQAMSDPEIRAIAAPFLGDAFGTRLAATADVAITPKTNLRLGSSSTGGGWMAIDSITSQEPVSLPRVALEESTEAKQLR